MTYKKVRKIQKFTSPKIGLRVIKCVENSKESMIL